MHDSTTQQSNHQPMCPRAQSNTQATSTHTRAGALTFPSSGQDGGRHTGGSRSLPKAHPCLVRQGSCGLLTSQAPTAHHRHRQ